MAVYGLLMRPVTSCDLECPTGSFPDLVQPVLQVIDLPLNLFEGVALRRDEQAPSSHQV